MPLSLTEFFLMPYSYPWASIQRRNYNITLLTWSLTSSLYLIVSMSSVFASLSFHMPYVSYDIYLAPRYYQNSYISHHLSYPIHFTRQYCHFHITSLLLVCTAKGSFYSFNTFLFPRTSKLLLLYFCTGQTAYANLMACCVHFSKSHCVKCLGRLGLPNHKMMKILVRLRCQKYN